MSRKSFSGRHFRRHTASRRNPRSGGNWQRLGFHPQSSRKGLVFTTAHTGTAPDTATIIDAAIDVAANAKLTGSDNAIEATVSDKGITPRGWPR